MRGGFADGVFEDVVAEDQADAVAAGEVLGQAQGLGDAAGAVLIGVVEVFEAELAAVAEQADEIAAVVSAGDEQNFLDAGLGHAFEGVIDHRLVVDREQMLVGDLGEGKSREPVPPARITPFMGCLRMNAHCRLTNNSQAADGFGKLEGNSFFHQAFAFRLRRRNRAAGDRPVR